ncbi:MAG: glycogen/starch synthase, partial [Pyrinomonadaceae bacterium]
MAILSSEAVPFAKTGGLGDVAGALPKALIATGDVNASLVLPLYEQTNRQLLRELFIDNLEVEWTGGNRHVQVWYSEAIGAPAFLIDAPEYFARPGIYGYTDDHTRYAFFSRAALALLKRLGHPPDVVHGNDWPCGFAIAELRARRAYDDFYKGTRTLFS